MPDLEHIQSARYLDSPKFILAFCTSTDVEFNILVQSITEMGWLKHTQIQNRSLPKTQAC